MARSASAMLALGFLVVAAFYMSEASALNVKSPAVVEAVKISVLSKCTSDVRLVVGVGVGKVLDISKGKLAVLAPLKVKLVALILLMLELFVFDKHGKLLKVK